MRRNFVWAERAHGRNGRHKRHRRADSHSDISIKIVRIVRVLCLSWSASHVQYKKFFCLHLYFCLYFVRTFRITEYTRHAQKWIGRPYRRLQHVSNSGFKALFLLHNLVKMKEENSNFVLVLYFILISLDILNILFRY